MIRLAQFENRSKGKATCTVDSLGRVNGFSITQTGFGYTTTPSVSLLVHLLLRLCSVTAILTQGDNGFHVTSFDITQAGFGYTVAPQVTLGFPPIFRSARGITSVSGGELISVTITDPGENYYDTPTVTFDIEPEETVVTEVGDIYARTIKSIDGVEHSGNFN